MLQSELHLFILWEKARNKQDDILNDIKKKFTILKVYDVTWDKENVSLNFTRFYGQKLPKDSIKEKECGTGPFLLIIILDQHPIYEIRETNSGFENVNINLFDSKIEYRKWTGGGHKIHATNSEKEANHDLTLLLGINLKDFLSNNNNKWNGNTIKIKKDLCGTKNWNSIEELFYVLNNTTDYVILRGDESIRNNVINKNHLDVDFLVKDYLNFQLLLNGKLVYSEFRPHIQITVKNKEYIFDLWDTSRNYFDPVWQIDMFNTKKCDGLTYILDEDNHYYTLLYHCIINKGKISKDYENYLFSHRLGDANKNNSWETILKAYLLKKKYYITLPQDKSISIKTNGVISDYVRDYGILIKNLEVYVKGDRYCSKVIEKKDSFIKCGTPFLINNEFHYLKALEPFVYFPKVIHYEKDSSIEISRVKGKKLFQFFSRRNNNIKLIKSFIKNSMDILSVLYNNNIIHRDFTPDNLLVQAIDNENCLVSLIDFGWAIDINQISVAMRPDWLGHIYAPPKESSDFYSLGSLLLELWPNIPFVNRISSKLHSVQAANYNDRTYIFDVINYVQKETFNPHYFKDINYYTKLFIKNTYKSIASYFPFIHRVRLFFHNHINF